MNNKNIDFKKAILGLTAICLSMAFVGCNGNETQETEWKTLFNGQNLDGWDVKIRGYELNDNFGETFRVEDGLLKARYDQYDTFEDRFGHIFYEEPYSDYHLVVEYRFVGDQIQGGADWAYMNNGIMYHSQSAESMALDQDFPVSIEYQLLGADEGTERSNGSVCTPGTHVRIAGELQTAHCIDSGGPTHAGEQWVTAELIVYGDSLAQHIMNGELVMEYSDLQLEDGTPLGSGYIALQSESHPTDFRSIRIRKLDR